MRIIKAQARKDYAQELIRKNQLCRIEPSKLADFIGQRLPLDCISDPLYDQYILIHRETNEAAVCGGELFDVAFEVTDDNR